MTELEMVKELKEDSYVRDYYSNYLDDIEFTLTKKSKKEQALDIVNDKCVNMYFIKYYCETVEDYNEAILKAQGCYHKLTEEEFNILKEVLE